MQVACPFTYSTNGRLAFGLWSAGKGGCRMYKALYRKYRPQLFADVVGQPQVTVTLKNELMAGRISHA